MPPSTRRHLVAHNTPQLVAVALLGAMFVLYVVMFAASIGSAPGGYEAASVTDNAVPLSLAAVGQSIVVLTRGLDLSVGGMMDISNSLAATKMHASLGSEVLWTLIILAIGAAGGLVNGLLVAFGRLQPILVTLGTLSIFQGIALYVLATPGGHVPSGYTGLFLNPGVPSALLWVLVLGFGWAAFRRTRLGVSLYAVGNGEAAARAHSVDVRRTKVLAYVMSGVLAAAAGIALATTTTGGDAVGGDVFTLSSIAAVVIGGVSLFGGRGSAVGAICGAFVLTLLVNVLFFANIDPLFQPFYQGLFLVLAVGASTLLGRMLEEAGMTWVLAPDRRKVLYGFAAAVALFVIGEIVKPGFASVTGIQEVLQIASFVGLVAAGQTFVILVGGIDLSVPWVLNTAAIVLVSVAQGGNGRVLPAVLLALLFGLVCGTINGVGIAVLGVPAVVMTLGMNGIVQGLALGATHGLTCQGCVSPAPTTLMNAVNGHVLGIDASLLVWLAVIGVVTFALSYTTFGRRVYAVGNSERASYLAGVNTRLVTVALYALSGLFAALAGIALTGFGGSATLGMGDPYLFQSIAAVVIGGTYILGGRGHYVGTVAGAIVLTALISVLLAKNAPDYARDIVYGVVILVILLFYGRQSEETA